jgi:DNA-binding NtrC family response regulator
MTARILLVEDSPNDAVLIRREVERAVPGVQVRNVMLLADCERALREFRPDLVVSDHNLPGCNGRAVLQAVTAWDPDVAFILVTGSLDEETAVDYMKAGAADYLLKDRLARLGPAVVGALDQARRRRSFRRQQLLLQKVIDANPSLVYVKDWDGRFILANHATAAAYGTTVDALLGRTVAEVDPLTAADGDRLLN